MKTDLNFASTLGFLTLSCSIFLLPIGTRPASAQNTFVFESPRVITGASEVFGEVILPNGLVFSGLGDSIADVDADGRITRLQLNPPPVILAPSASNPSRTAAEFLIRAIAGDPAVINNIEGVSAQIRALGGINGLD